MVKFLSVKISKEEKQMICMFLTDQKLLKMKIISYIQYIIFGAL